MAMIDQQDSVHIRQWLEATVASRLERQSAAFAGAIAAFVSNAR
jgi:hypothetical protein